MRKLALLIVTVLVTLALAAPAAAQTTPSEYCNALANFAQSVAEVRDGGVPMNTLVEQAMTLPNQEQRIDAHKKGGD